MTEYIIDEQGNVIERLVRCETCHYYSDDVTHDGNHWCRFMAQYVGPHGFCAWGVKSAS